MKRKHLFLLAFSLLFVVFSCVKDNVVDISRKLPQEPQPPATSGNTITMDSLRSLALNLPAIFSQQPQTRSTGKTIKEIVSLSSFFNQPATRTATVSGKNPVSDIYVVNYSGDAGFAIISADTRLVDVLAYSDYGNITDTLDNPGVKLFMSGVYDYADYMLNYLPEKGDSVAVHGMVLPKNSGAKKTARYDAPKTLSTVIETVNENPYYPPEEDDGYYYYQETVEEITDWSGTVRGPVVKVNWGQYFPFNEYVPICPTTGYHMPAGCVATAIAQIMSYHKWPETIGSSYTSFTDLDWDVLASRKYGPEFNDSDEKHQIATLFSYIGTNVGMEYDCYENGGSGSNIGKAESAFRNKFIYLSDGVVSYSTHQVRNNLRNVNDPRPVYVRGADKNGNGAHAWVVDGYKDQYRTCMELAYWYRYEGGDSPRELFVVDTLRTYKYINDYVHCNWGWEGTNNGWFYDNAFIDRTYFRTDYPAEEEPGNSYYDQGQFSINVEMIKNLRPRGKIE